jgi:sulfatase maturation enzyme AslB (radical SAM superfamily)
MKILNKETYSMTVLLTRQCNLDCSYCYVHKQKKLEYDKLLIQKGIIFFISQPWYNKEVTFYGWELTLFPVEELESIIVFTIKLNKYFSKNIKIIVVTNWTIYSKKHYEVFSKYADEIRISIDWKPENHDIDRWDWTWNVILNNFKIITSDFPEIIKKISFNKVISPNNINSFVEDCMYIIETFIINTSWLWLTVWTAQSISWWDKKHPLLLRTSYVKLLNKLKTKWYNKYVKRFFNISVWYCFYASLALWYDGKIYNCDFNANRVDDINDKTYIYDIKKDLINPLLDISSCEYDITSKICKNEECSMCTNTCINYDVLWNKQLDIDKQVSIELIKKDWRIFRYTDYSKKNIAIKFINTIWNNRKWLNVITTFLGFLWISEITILKDWDYNIDFYKHLQEKTNGIKFNLIDIITEEKICIIDLDKEQMYNKNWDKIGNFFDGISYMDII